MMDIKERKKIIFDIIQLEKEQDSLENEIFAKEKMRKKLKNDLEFAQEEYSKLENSGVKKFFLGLTGKREVRLQEAQNELRRIHAELSSVEFEITSAQRRIENIVEELKETAECATEYISDLIEEDNGEQIRNTVVSLREIANLRPKISEKIIELKPLLERAAEIYYYGDINTDFSGKRYNKKDSTLRTHTLSIKIAVNELLILLKEYNQVVPEEIRIDFHEKWMDNEAYWDGQQLAEDSYERVKKVDDWFFRFSNLWKTMKKKQDETVENMRNEVLDYLV